MSEDAPVYDVTQAEAVIEAERNNECDTVTQNCEGVSR